MKDMFRGRKEDIVYQNVFHIAPNQNFVIRVGGSQSHVMYFDENGLIHNADSNTTYFLSMLICGLATIISAPAHFTEQEIEKASMLRQVMGDKAKIKKVSDKTCVIIGDNSSCTIDGKFFPSLEKNMTVYLSDIQ